jgi:hypothetical protein
MPDSYNSVSFSGELDVDPSHARAKWELRIFIVMITYIYAFSSLILYADSSVQVFNRSFAMVVYSGRC